MTKEVGEQYSTKYRPYDIEDVIGNETAKNKVMSQLERRTAHCILLSGPSGCGKSTLAKILANGFSKGVKTDVEEINGASEGTIDNIRSLVKRVEHLPRKGDRVVIIDEAHAITGASKSALLVPSETPPHAKLVWIFATDKPWLLDQQLLNRCIKIDVTKPSEEELVKLLRQVCKKEKAFTEFDKMEVKKICREVARAADFVPREALQIIQGAYEGKTTNFKDIIKSLRNNVTASLDNAALQILMSMYSSEKSLAFRRKFLATQFASQEAMSLLIRLTAISYNILLDLNGVDVKASYYYKKELEPRKAYPSSQQATVVSARLADLKLKLTQVNIDPAHLLLPELIMLQEVLDAKSHLMLNGEDE